MKGFGDCSFCGGSVEERKIEYDYRRKAHLLIIENVPAGVCRQCGEVYFLPQILKKMDIAYHDIFDRHKEPEQIREVPAVSL